MAEPRAAVHQPEHSGQSRRPGLLRVVSARAGLPDLQVDVPAASHRRAHRHRGRGLVDVHGSADFVGAPRVPRDPGHRGRGFADAVAAGARRQRAAMGAAGRSAVIATSELSAHDTQRAYARAAGLFYLLVLAFDIAGLVIASSIEGGGGFAASASRVGASEVVYRLGLCLSLLGSMSTIPLAIGLYVTLKPVDGNLAMTALLFRSAEAAVGAVGIVGAFAVLQIYLQAGRTAAFGADQLWALIGMHPRGTTNDVAAI